MTGKILILGGYGNFGKRIAKALTECGTPVVIADATKVARKQASPNCRTGCLRLPPSTFGLICARGYPG